MKLGVAILKKKKKTGVFGILQVKKSSLSVIENILNHFFSGYARLGIYKKYCRLLKFHFCLWTVLFVIVQHITCDVF